MNPIDASEYSPVDAVEYSLRLGTGETLQISELDERITGILTDPDSKKKLLGLLDRCTRASHSVMQEAKLGNTRDLERLLKTPPVGALMKLDRPVCAEIKRCSMADVRKCTTRNVKGKEGAFPHCWEYAIDDASPEESDLARCVVHAWRLGRYVVIVSADQDL